MTSEIHQDAWSALPLSAGVALLRPAIGALLLTIALVIHSPPAQSEETVFDLRIERGKVPQSMRVIRVHQGDTVRLRWTTDRRIVVHLHGYDIEKTVEPGSATEMTFIARIAGRFSVEEHKPKAQGGHSHSEAALVRIDIRPR
jgi:hypothetical protein